MHCWSVPIPDQNTSTLGQTANRNLSEIRTTFCKINLIVITFCQNIWFHCTQRPFLLETDRACCFIQRNHLGKWAENSPGLRCNLSCKKSPGRGLLLPPFSKIKDLLEDIFWSLGEWHVLLLETREQNKEMKFVHKPEIFFEVLSCSRHATGSHVGRGESALWKQRVFQAPCTGIYRAAHHSVQFSIVLHVHSRPVNLRVQWTIGPDSDNSTHLVLAPF